MPEPSVRPGCPGSRSAGQQFVAADNNVETRLDENAFARVVLDSIVLDRHALLLSQSNQIGPAVVVEVVTRTVTWELCVHLPPPACYPPLYPA